MQQKPETHAMTIRLPIALIEAMKQIAEQNKRSLRAEIEVALELYEKDQTRKRTTQQS